MPHVSIWPLRVQYSPQCSSICKAKTRQQSIYPELEYESVNSIRVSTELNMMWSFNIFILKIGLMGEYLWLNIKTTTLKIAEVKLWAL